MEPSFTNLEPHANASLQCIIGVDKKNPVFTIYREVTNQQLHVYYGQERLEVLADCRESLSYKLLVARLYNAGIKVGVAQPSIRGGPQNDETMGSGFERR